MHFSSGEHFRARDESVHVDNKCLVELVGREEAVQVLRTDRVVFYTVLRSLNFIL